MLNVRPKLSAWFERATVLGAILDSQCVWSPRIARCLKHCCYPLRGRALISVHGFLDNEGMSLYSTRALCTGQLSALRRAKAGRINVLPCGSQYAGQPTAISLQLSILSLRIVVEDVVHHGPSLAQIMIVDTPLPAADHLSACFRCTPAPVADRERRPVHCAQASTTFWRS
ncbi:hypothetical protein M430DRAFT_20828 [Amorphotheca resinae ATCC 22711]|jgi:hypothetical protein|uniref:Uncharacterized protein n=1 Tax=Amorphotheca resinae ATCC 22711 TaxID=857342 RepID=A0A2T3AW84_AMORE|nr:hypothetical protein M430DRAFT_20828 [Amorphotheca resinae ATCC 22711]PSS12913.1 hypothetical protein M430DRAFT_20828 [Amorphotheca resinae ATCC 22711]